MPFIVIATPWAGTGTPGNPFRPQVLSAFNVRGCEDVTRSVMGPRGIPGANLVVVLAFVTNPVLAQIDAHPQWRDAVLWVRGDPARNEDGFPDQAFRDRLRDALLARGLTLNNIAQALGDTAGVRRRAIAERLRDWLMQRPKG